MNEEQIERIKKQNKKWYSILCEIEGITERNPAVYDAIIEAMEGWEEE